MHAARSKRGSALAKAAGRHGVSPAAVALAWTIRDEGIVTIPKAGSIEHLDQNAAAAGLRLDPEDLRELDRDFPPPERDLPLEMI